MPTVLHPSSTILLIDPDQELLTILARSVPLSTADVCLSFEEAEHHMALAVYQLLICPYRIALLNQYALVALNRLHNPFAPFVVTMRSGESSFVQQTIDHGALGVLDETHTTEDVLRTIRPLLWLYQLRHSLDRREKWMTDFRQQLCNNPIGDKSESLRENRTLCQQSLLAIEAGMQVLRVHAEDLVNDATERMLCASREWANLGNSKSSISSN
jgi:DNA-binding NtrC family response regulator